VADNFWLSDKQWAAIAPHLPMVYGTGTPGWSPRHPRQSMACTSRRIWAVYDGVQSIQSVEPALPVAAHILGARRMLRSALAHGDRQFGGQDASFGDRREKDGRKTRPSAARAALPHDEGPRARRRRRLPARLPADARTHRRHQAQRLCSLRRRQSEQLIGDKGTTGSFAFLPANTWHDANHPQKDQPQSALSIRC
jgi:hypothetical protein